MKDMGPRPEDCTGIQLLDETKDFSKYNCKWTKNNQGRPKITRQDVEKPKKVVIKNPKNICLVLEKDLFEYIKRQALHRSVQEGTLIETNELIREALYQCFPMPKQMDMFKKTA